MTIDDARTQLTFQTSKMYLNLNNMHSSTIYSGTIYHVFGLYLYVKILFFKWIVINIWIVVKKPYNSLVKLNMYINILILLYNNIIK